MSHLEDTIAVTTDQIRKGEAVRFLKAFFDTDSKPGDADMIREALLWNVEEMQLSLCLDALRRLEIAAGRRAA